MKRGRWRPGLLCGVLEAWNKHLAVVRVEKLCKMPGIDAIVSKNIKVVDTKANEGSKAVNAG